MGYHPPPAPQKNPRPYIPHTPDSHRIKGAWMFDSWCVVIQFQFGLVSLFSRLLSLNYYSGLRNIKCLALKWIQFYVYFWGGGAKQSFVIYFFCSVNQTWKWVDQLQMNLFWRKVVPRSTLLQPVIFNDMLLFLVLCLQNWFSLNLCFLTVDQDTTSKAEKTSKCRGKNYRSSRPCIDSQLSQESARLHPILWAIIL